MSVKINHIKDNKPALFDWLVLMLSISLGFIFPSLKDFVHSPAFSNLILAALVLYVVGTCLKHQPLYYRLSMSGTKLEQIPYLLFLLIGHWSIIVALVIVSSSAFRRITGIPAFGDGEVPSWWLISVVLVGAGFITWLAFRRGPKVTKTFSPQYIFYRELAADILLITGVGILSFIFWEKGVMGAFDHMPLESFGDVVGIFLFLSIAYMMFYLPLRYLYLIEDHFSRRAWKRLLLIFLVVLIRSLIASYYTD